MIAVYNTLNSKLLKKIDNEQESIFVQIKFKNSTLIVGCSYITKPATLDEYIKNAQAIEDLFSKYPGTYFAIFFTTIYIIQTGTAHIHHFIHTQAILIL